MPAPHPIFVSQVERGLYHWPLYIAGLVLIIISVIIMNLPLAAAMAVKGVTGATNPYDAGLDSNLVLILVLLPFVAGLWVTLGVVRHLHRRPARSVVTARDRIDWRRMITAASVTIVLACLSLLISFGLAPDEMIWRGISSDFWILLLICLTLLPMQVAFEEVIIRGYLMQGIGWGLKNALIAVVITSAIFAIGHGVNPEVARYGMPLMMSYYLSYAIFLAVIALMDDGLELSIGCHFGTNFFAAVILGYEGGALQTDALWYTTNMTVDWWSMGGLWLTLLITYLIFRALYKWPSVSKLWKPPETLSCEVSSPRQVEPPVIS